MTLDILLGISLGVGLSAACGFRVFVPLLASALAARRGWLAPAHGFEWMGSQAALIAFGCATALELAAYYIPWLDNALDTVATPLAVAAGILASASVITDLPPFVKWTLAVIAGGGLAALVQGGTVAVRMKSSVLTGGLGNSVVATLELLASVMLSSLTLFLPALGFLLTIIVVLPFVLLYRRFFRKKTARYKNGEDHASEP